MLLIWLLTVRTLSKVETEAVFANDSNSSLSAEIGLLEDPILDPISLQFHQVVAKPQPKELQSEC